MFSLTLRVLYLVPIKSYMHRKKMGTTIGFATLYLPYRTNINIAFSFFPSLYGICIILVSTHFVFVSFCSFRSKMLVHCLHLTNEYQSVRCTYVARVTDCSKLRVAPIEQCDVIILLLMQLMPSTHQITCVVHSIASSNYKSIRSLA